MWGCADEELRGKKREGLRILLCREDYSGRFRLRETADKFGGAMIRRMRPNPHRDGSYPFRTLIEPSPVWTVINFPPPLSLPRTSLPLILPSVVIGRFTSMCPSPVRRYKSAERFSGSSKLMLPSPVCSIHSSARVDPAVARASTRPSPLFRLSASKRPSALMWPSPVLARRLQIGRAHV